MIAYLLLVHQHPNQFKKLFQAIHHPDNVYLIHVDKKTPMPVYLEIEAFLNDYSNASFLERKITNWGGYSLVDAHLRGMDVLLKTSMKWQYFINLSGQDFPLKTQAYIHDYLKGHPYTDFMALHDQRLERPESINRIENYVFETGPAITSVGPTRKNSYLSDVTPYVGSPWLILSRKFCDFVVNHPDTDRFKTFYKNTLMADEGFFPTVLMNTGYQNKVLLQDDAREVNRVPSPDDVAPRSLPYTMADAALLGQSEKLFAHKFDETVDADIIDVLAAQIASANQVTPPLVDEPLPLA